jgi:hypothetical protein
MVPRIDGLLERRAGTRHTNIDTPQERRWFHVRLCGLVAAIPRHRRHSFLISEVGREDAHVDTKIVSPMSRARSKRAVRLF